MKNTSNMKTTSDMNKTSNMKAISYNKTTLKMKIASTNLKNTGFGCALNHTKPDFFCAIQIKPKMNWFSFYSKDKPTSKGVSELVELNLICVSRMSTNES